MLFLYFFFFFNDTATTEIYTLSLHDALPIFLTTDLRTSIKLLVQSCFDRWQIEVNHRDEKDILGVGQAQVRSAQSIPRHPADRKSTRLNSSHGYISYAVFCLKKKKTRRRHCTIRIRFDSGSSLDHHGTRLPHTVATADRRELPCPHPGEGMRRTRRHCMRAPR